MNATGAGAERAQDCRWVIGVWRMVGWREGTCCGVLVWRRASGAKAWGSDRRPVRNESHCEASVRGPAPGGGGWDLLLILLVLEGGSGSL